MRISDFKRVARLLKAAYAEVEKEALKAGLSLASDEYEELIDKTRLAILSKTGFTLEEYREAKEKAALVPAEGQKMLAIVEEAETNLYKRMDDIEEAMASIEVPTTDLIAEIAENIFKNTPPQVNNLIVKEVEKPIVKEYTTVKEIIEKYDDKALKDKIQDILDTTDSKFKSMKEEVEAHIAATFKENINIMGMPDFRKLAMGIDTRLAQLEASGGSGSGAVDSVNGQTGVVLLDTGDIADTTNARYVTDAQLTVLGNTSGTNTGDQTSIVGITGTKAEFDTAVSDGNFLFVGDITQYTDEMAQDAVGAMVNTSLTYVDGGPTLGLTSRTIGGVAFDGTANITVATATGGFTVSGGNLALGTNSLTMTGSIAATGSRVTKGWFTDIESTNMPTVGGTAILTSLTAPQFTTIELGAASDTTLSRSAAGVLAVEGVVIPSISSTNTLTNKRITKRVQSVADAATITPNADSDDCVDITAIAQAFTIANPTGTPTNFQQIIIRIKDNGTARAITFGSDYVAGGVALPTTTVLSKILVLGFQYNTANSLNKWQLIASAQEA